MVYSIRMAVKAMFESIRYVPSLLKKKEDVFGKGGATSGNKICAGIGNTPAETHKFLKQLEKYKNVSRSSVFKWQKRFSDERENVMDDVRDGKPSFRNFGP